jgi:hypothetical protein
MNFLGVKINIRKIEIKEIKIKKRLWTHYYKIDSKKNN